MDARNDDDVINQEAAGEEFILSGSATRIWFRLSLLNLGVPQKTRWQAQQEGGREGSVKELECQRWRGPEREYDRCRCKSVRQTAASIDCLELQLRAASIPRLPPRHTPLPLIIQPQLPLHLTDTCRACHG
jgi:hypothetical protein